MTQRAELEYKILRMKRLISVRYRGRTSPFSLREVPLPTCTGQARGRGYATTYFSKSGGKEAISLQPSAFSLCNLQSTIDNLQVPLSFAWCVEE